MFNLIPFPIKLLVIITALGGALGFGYMKGLEQSKLAIAQFESKANEQIADLEKKNSEISNTVVTEYVDKVKKIKEKEYVYVDAAEKYVPSQSDLSNGWVFTHDIGATGGDADSTRSSEAGSSGIKDNQALTTILGNYSVCTQNAQQLIWLQSWIEHNKKEIEESNTKNKPKKKRFGVF
jgi:hypothetical protein